VLLFWETWWCRLRLGYAGSACSPWC